MPESLEEIITRAIIMFDKEIGDIKNELESLKAKLAELEQQEGGAK